MKKKRTYIILIAVLVVILSIPTSPDWLVDTYFQVVPGSVIKLDAQCYGVPNNWTITSVEIRNNRKVYDLQTKVGNEYMFSSVSSRNENSIDSFKRLQLVSEKKGLFRIYELVVLPADNPVRYLSFISDHNLMVTGSSPKTLESLSLAIREAVC